MERLTRKALEAGIDGDPAKIAELINGRTASRARSEP
jgi:hypothetical protein